LEGAGGGDGVQGFFGPRGSERNRNIIWVGRARVLFGAGWRMRGGVRSAAFGRKETDRFQSTNVKSGRTSITPPNSRPIGSAPKIDKRFSYN
jgi:hypothetical protein